MQNLNPTKNKVITSHTGLVLFALIVSSSVFSQNLQKAPETISQATTTTEAFLPVTLIDWNIILKNSNVELSWTTTVEKNSNHFLVERSTNGINFTEVGRLNAAGNSDITNKYKYSDKLNSNHTGIIYYRLKSADRNGNIKQSDVRIVRAKANNTMSISAFPNPVVNEIRITIPQNWQSQKVTYEISNANGVVVSQVVKSKS